MQKDVVWFKELSNKDIPIAGGKGASLCEMYNAGFPIPPGFIITAQAYQKFLTQTGIDKQIYSVLKDLDVDDNAKLQEAAKKVQKIVEETQMPLSIQQSITEMYETMTVGEGLNGLSQQAKAMVKSGRDYPFVAVRSSATAEDLPSISEDEYVLLKANEKPLFGRMKDIFNQIKTGDEIFILCMENGNTSWKKVSQTYRHKVDHKKLFKITTETGRKITLSPNHTLITLDENTLQPRVAEISSLKGGEKVPVTKSIQLLDEKETFVKYIIDSLSNSEPAQNNIACLTILLELFGIKFIIKSNECTETIFLSGEELEKLKGNIGHADFESIKTMVQVSAEPNKSLNCYLAINSNNRAAQLMVSESILWDRIIKIESVDYDSCVYDFSVPDVENFASGLGSIITHNSASFAGQQASFLNIRGTKQLLLSTQQCWASLFNARAIYYRIKNNFPHEKVLIAVVVQKMVNADKAGVMFSVNPISQDENEIMIETAWGLGEALVSGSVNPDQYIVDKKAEKIKSVMVRKQAWAYVLDSNYNKTMKKELPKEIQEKQKLSESEILVLAKLAKKAEEHYKAPQDMEYAIEKNKIMVVQSRPITTLKKHVIEEVVQRLAEAKVLTKGMSASPGVASGMVKIVANADELTKIEKGDVLVAVMTDPDYVAAMQRAAAIVTEQGGTACHAAIVSREMGVPCIVGTENATHVLKEGSFVTVDAINGLVYEGKVELNHAVEENHNEEHFVESYESVTDVKVIMDLPEFAEKAAATGADGVGLLRCEMMMAKHEHPAWLLKNNKKDILFNELVDGISGIASHFKGKPVWYRTSDFRTDEYRNLQGGKEEPEEDNPMLGWHGIRRSVDMPELLMAEFEAIKEVHKRGLTNVGVMLPMVTHVEQVEFGKKMLKKAGFNPGKDIEFGVMIETPASVQIIEEICKVGIDFVSFGTNDLTQFTMTIDRNNAHVQKWYDEMHPAVLRQIKYVIEVCKKYNVNTSICGQAGSRPEMAEFLVKCGIDSISANSDAVHKIRQVVSRVERKLILEAARRSEE